ncbi:hypothetical protein JCM3765_000214 [Sporobolomyces pararoseus]
MAASTSFVFKLHYDDGPVHVSRRYGYVGRIDQPQVYSGLYDRTSQVLSLPNGTFTLALKDSLGNPKIKLESFQSFKKFVCKPLFEDPNSVKIDEKGRRVLVFIVEKKKKKEDEETVHLKSSSSSSTVNPRLASPSSRSVQTDSSLTTTTVTEGGGGGGGSVVDSNSPLSTGGKNAFDKLSKRFEPVQVEKPGYHTAYSTPTITSPSSSSISTLVVDEKHKKKKEKEESWGTVKGMLENFVKDLNLHLADTFGDEASSFRLKTDDDDNHSEVVVVGGDNNKGEEIKTTSTTPSVPVQNKALHPHVFCDRCLKTISGSRFKCRSCSNYDLCQNCIDFRTQFHPGVHTFSEILKPGSIPLPTTRGAVEMQQLPPLSIPTPAPAPTTITTSTTTSSVRPIVHSATCDVCQKTIIGTRMKCLNCPDYDLCSNCFNKPSTLSSIHPNHSFVSIHHPKDLKLQQPHSSLMNIHHHIRCDGCGKSPIKGNRFKCMMFDCKDFDLCQNCESDPIPRHPEDHVLLKIKKPINQLNLFGLSACGGINGGGGRENFNETVKRAQEIANRVGGGGGVSSSSSLSNNVVNPISSFISSIGAAVVQAHTTTSPQIQATTTVSDEKEKKEEEKIEPFTTSIEKKQVEEESESESEQEEKVEDENFEKSASVTTPEEEEEEEGRLGCSFVADVTLKDGTIVPAGSEFNKIWKIKNTGTLPWNQVKLVNVGGLQTKQDSEGLLNLKPGEEIEVLVECKAPEEDGRFMSFFRLQTKNGLKFGDRFWLDITVESEGTSSSRNLSSSSIITPCLNVGGKSASTVPETITTGTSSVAPSTTFSLSSGLEEEESEFESIQQGGEGGTVQDSEEEEEEMSESESEESSELEEDSDDDDDEFVVLSEEDR